MRRLKGIKFYAVNSVVFICVIQGVFLGNKLIIPNSGVRQFSGLSFGFGIEIQLAFVFQIAVDNRFAGYNEIQRRNRLKGGGFGCFQIINKQLIALVGIIKFAVCVRHALQQISGQQGFFFAGGQLAGNNLIAGTQIQSVSVGEKEVDAVVLHPFHIGGSAKARQRKDAVIGKCRFML